MKTACEICHPQCSPHTQRWWRGVWARPYLLAPVDLPFAMSQALRCLCRVTEWGWLLRANRHIPLKPADTY